VIKGFLIAKDMIHINFMGSLIAECLNK